MTEKLLSSIEGKKRQLDSHIPLSSTIVKKLEEEFSIAWTYNSNAIEGNTLTLQETEIVLNQGITIGGKSVNEHFEAINHKKGIDYIKQIVTKKENISEEVIKNIHKIILSSIDDNEAGSYRVHNVRIVGVRHIPPQSIKISKLMKDFIEWYQLNEFSMNIPQMASELHYRFVIIHPFIDGNGRVARLLMNLFLMRNGYPPAIILKVDRKRYYRVLNQANLDNKLPLDDFIGRSIERSLILYLNSITPNLTNEKMFITLKEATKYCDYSQEYLSLLSRKGKLTAIKINKDWMTTKEAIEEYLGLLKRN